LGVMSVETAASGAIAEKFTARADGESGRVATPKIGHEKHYRWVRCPG